MGTFNGRLTPNEVFASLYNMIISQEVFANNIGKHQTLVDKARVDGGLFGDTKLYYSTDALKSKKWAGDAEAPNLLSIMRPEDPHCQAIKINTFRYIGLTIDDYLSKRAWADEAAFSSFNSVMLGWLRETKRIYDGTTYNTFIGTNQSAVGAQSRQIDLSAVVGDDLEAAKLEGLLIAEDIANLLVELGDYSRDFNDYGVLRSYDESDIQIIWNSKYVNKIRKVDLPTIFHKEGLVDKFEQEVLPARYFGDVQTTAHTTVAGERTMVEVEISGKDYFPGDVLPTGTSVGANESYIVNDGVICKVLVKLPPFMSGFEVGTSFYNALSLTTNNYLIWGHNELEHLSGFPCITVTDSRA